MVTLNRNQSTQSRRVFGLPLLALLALAFLTLPAQAAHVGRRHGHHPHHGHRRRHGHPRSHTLRRSQTLGYKSHYIPPN